MSEGFDAVEREAVSRLYELVRNGETDNCEFSQLDSMVYERLRKTYPVQDSDLPRTQTAVAN